MNEEEGEGKNEEKRKVVSVWLKQWGQKGGCLEMFKLLILDGSRQPWNFMCSFIHNPGTQFPYKDLFCLLKVANVSSLI